MTFRAFILGCILGLVGCANDPVPAPFGDPEPTPTPTMSEQEIKEWMRIGWNARETKLNCDTVRVAFDNLPTNDEKRQNEKIISLLKRCQEYDNFETYWDGVLKIMRKNNE